MHRSIVWKPAFTYEANVDDENCLLLALNFHPPYLNRFALRYFTSDKEEGARIQVKLFVTPLYCSLYPHPPPPNTGVTPVVQYDFSPKRTVFEVNG
jgi:hypothetical protein